jgi:glutaredoxin 3|tara:strand:- start:430 stop:663 length:234 start_codon:yes stop_codon:yes gene_type:complete
MKEVIVYSKNMCGYCVQAKNWLKNKGIEYKEINIEEQPEAREFVISEGHRTMPQIYIDGKSMGGYTELVKLDESAFN